MGAELRLAPYAESVQLLVVRNYGQSEALNVRVTFDPEIPDPEPQKASQSMTPDLKRRYAQPIKSLTPGQELSNIYFSGRGSPGTKRVNFEPIPEQATVTIEYDGPGTTRRWFHTEQRHYTSEFHLDVELLATTTMVTSSAAPDQQLKKAVEHLGKLVDVLKNLKVVTESGDSFIARILAERQKMFRLSELAKRRGRS